MREAAAMGLSPSRPWGRAALWVAFLGPFFFATYGLATWVTARRPEVAAVVFGWEHAIPFVPWTIVPYWTIDLFYGLSLFACANRGELDTHAKRLLTAQIVAIASFLLFPLRFTFERPATDGVFGDLFRVLTAFDQPFNQAPSLHIALLVATGRAPDADTALARVRAARPQIVLGDAHCARVAAMAPRPAVA